MEDTYTFKENEERMRRLWEEGGYFTPHINPSRRPYSMFLAPPNASGPLHVGNALMIAIQDILARYHRAKGEPTLWIPGTDHGGYETQVTYEREMGKGDEVKNASNRKEQFASINEFVKHNNEAIIHQIQAMGASVDWSRLRFTLDEHALAAVLNMFKKMVSDNLLYRSSYMVNYCTSCATVLADIELKEVPTPSPLYFIKFPFQNEDGYLSLATTRPEFIFAVTDMLIHPQDKRFAQHIGKVVVNPVSGKEVRIVESKRKYDAKNPEAFLTVFSPSNKRYDFEYALRNALRFRNLLDWDGTLVEQNPGVTPEEARVREVASLAKSDAIEKIDDAYFDTALLCKKGHIVQSIIRMTWFLRLDDEKTPLRKPALAALRNGNITIQPRWREKGLIEWIGKMHDWPIARQNVWGITIPVWYEISDPTLYTIWFLNKKGERRYSNLKALLDEGISLDEIAVGLERIYADEGCIWTLEREEGKIYLPETDTFDTWFSSCAWGVVVFGDSDSTEVSYFYPSSVVVTGYDLLRLFISRTILLSQYLTGRLPFRRIYFHQLLKSADGQKMSKSLGNAITLDQYLEKFGADVTRMALISYTSLQEDFFFSEEKLEFFKEFSYRLWKMGRVCDAANTYSIGQYVPELLSDEDKQLLLKLRDLGGVVDSSVEKYLLAQAQEKLVSFLEYLEKYASNMLSREDRENALSVFYNVFKEYVTLLHPFMPFMTEALYSDLYKTSRPLAAIVVKNRRQW